MSRVGLNALISSAHDRKYQEEPPGRDNPAPAPQSWAVSGSFSGCGRWGWSFRQKNNMQVCMEAANSEKIKPGPHPEGHASNLKSQHREQVSEALREWGAPGPGLHRDVHAAGKRSGRQGQRGDTE